jgi:hypothetical protein
VSDITPKAFRDDLLGSFETFWTANNPTVPVAYPNLPFNSEDAGEASDAAWVRLFIAGTAEEGQRRFSSSIERTQWHRAGKLTIEIYVREGSSTDRAYDLASSVALWLENSGASYAILSNISAPVEIGPDGTWFQVALSADWLYITDRAA